MRTQKRSLAEDESIQYLKQQFRVDGIQQSRIRRLLEFAEVELRLSMDDLQKHTGKVESIVILHETQVLDVLQTLFVNQNKMGRLL
jgi:hypothetical protein